MVQVTSISKLSEMMADSICVPETACRTVCAYNAIPTMINYVPSDTLPLVHATRAWPFQNTTFLPERLSSFAKVRIIDYQLLVSCEILQKPVSAGDHV